MKRLDKYLLKELSLTWAAVCLVLLMILLSNSVIHILGGVAEGEIPRDIILPFLLTNFASLLVAIVPFSLYLGIMLGLGRLYQDSEMLAISAGGIGLWPLYRPILILSLFAVVLISLLIFVINPWAARVEQSLVADAAGRSELSGITPGKFNISRNQDVVIFVRELSADRKVMRDLFVHTRDSDNADGVEVAAYASQENIGEREYLLFHQGQRYMGKAGEQQYSTIEFERHGIRVPRSKSTQASLDISGKGLFELLESTDLNDKAELHRRFGFPIAAFILALLALPLSHTSPRKGRYARLGLAILIYIPYGNFISIGKRWLADGITPVWLGLWWVHVPVLLVALLLLARRSGMTRRLFNKRNAA